jgi:hypothetical protein
MERAMKQFLIKYSLKNGTEPEWRGEISRFIEALDHDPELSGRISYRCMKRRDGSDYYHIATPVDDAAAKILQGRDYFTRYTEQSKLASGGQLEVIPLELVAETK